MERDKQRETLGSRLGFILLSAGCAIGIGNVWRFPWMVGQYGGGAFVLCYLIFLLIFGIPIMSMEFSLGRASRKSPVRLYHSLEKPGQKWHIHGYLAMAGNYLLMMFYTTVTAWMVYYLIASLRGSYRGLDNAGITQFFTGMLQDSGNLIPLMAGIVVLGFFVLSFGLQKGLERVTKVMMVLLLLLMLGLAIRSLSLEDGRQGLEFYLKPDLEKMRQAGITNVILAAMNQSFFTLSLGIGAMAIFGSYIDKEQTLLGESINVAILDTLVAVCSGLIIFPACAAYGVDVESGPSLLFMALPKVFNAMDTGRIWGTLFFLFMFFAAASTVLAVFENIVACCMDLFHWSRRQACVINIFIVIGLSLPCILGYSRWTSFAPLGPGTSVLDLEDFLVSNLLLPLGSLVYLLFCTGRRGWGWDQYVAEANSGKGIKVKSWMRVYLSYILPLLVIVVFVMGLI